jgi:hypothetical protein
MLRRRRERARPPPAPSVGAGVGAGVRGRPQRDAVGMAVAGPLDIVPRGLVAVVEGEEGEGRGEGVAGAVPEAPQPVVEGG